MAKLTRERFNKFKDEHERQRRDFESTISELQSTKSKLRSRIQNVSGEVLEKVFNQVKGKAPWWIIAGLVALMILLEVIK